MSGNSNIYSTKTQELLKNMISDDGTSIVIASATIDNTIIGGTTPASAAFTEIKVTSGAGDGYTLQSDASGNLTYIKNNLTATADPTATWADTGAGYSITSRWLNASSAEIFMCLDNTASSATWEKTSLTIDDLGSIAVQNANTVTITGGNITVASIVSDVASIVDLTASSINSLELAEGASQFTISGGTGTSRTFTVDETVSLSDKADKPDENDIGVPGAQGFGVGICPKTDTELAAFGITPMAGYNIKGHDNYGNYETDSGSQIVWIPKFYYRMNNTENPTFPKVAYLVAITDITQAADGVMTITGHGIPSDVTNARIYVTGVEGMTEVNDLTFDCAYDGADTVTLGVNTSGYDAYTEGGWAYIYHDDIDIKPASYFADTAAANAAGYALHRAFIDGGVEQDGFFRFKYTASELAWGTGYVAASVKNGNPISTHSTHNPISDLTACSENYYYEAINAAKAVDGENGEVNASSIWFCESVFISDALAKLSLAHGQAANGIQNCAWWDATDNFPKGNNNNALKDTDDSTVAYQSDGYSNCAKTGSGSLFAKTTHNGQNCGIADLNGNMYRIAIGMTCEASTSAIEAWSQANPSVITVTDHGLTTGDYVMLLSITQADWSGASDKIWQVTRIDDDTFSIEFNSSGFGIGYDAGTDAGTVTIGTFYLAKEATAMKDFTSGVSLATDHWGATGVAAMMDEIDMPFKSASGFALRFGNGNVQVFAEDVSGSDWANACAGLPRSGDGVSSGGTDLLGKDSFYQYVRNQLCVLCGGHWYSTTHAGVWLRYLLRYRTNSHSLVGFAPACYLD